MPFMRSESCSFIWLPKVVTWKRFKGSMKERESTGGGENLGAAANRPYGSVTRHGGWFRGDAVRRGDPCGADRAGNDRAADHTEVAAGRLHRLHRGVYAVGHTGVGLHGRWIAALFACGKGALLSHRS